MLDIPNKHPIIWLCAFAIGSIMIIAAIGFALGTIAAGYAAGFFALSGSFAYEILTRRNREDNIINKINKIEITQKNITKVLENTRQDVTSMKDDMITATRAIENMGHKSAATQTVLRSFERINNRQRPSSHVTEFMSSKPPENTQETNNTTLRAQKYKDILLNKKTEDEVEQQSIETAPEYSETVMVELINNAVNNDKIEIFAQPIVKLPSRRLRYLELYARIRAKTGVYLAGHTYRPLAEKEQLITNVDGILLNHTIDMIKNDSRKNLEIGYFINVSSRSIKDNNFMNELLDFVRNNRDLCNRLVLEFQHNDFDNLPPELQRVINGIAKIGCKISIDNIDYSNIDIEYLTERGVSFLKYDAQNILSKMTSYEGEMEIMRLKKSLDRANIALIVEKVEGNHALKELLDFELDLGEGHLFGRPDLEMAYRPKRSAVF